MAQRTTAAKVADIVKVDSNIGLQDFIDTAVALVDWLDTQDTDGDLTAALLERIEAFLSAHFYSHRDQLYTKKNTGRAGAEFQVKVDLGLASTQYGQTAMNLDITGLLAKKNKEMIEGGKRKVTFTWLGKAPSDQTDYVDRD